MFTGIIQTIGKIVTTEAKGGDLRLHVHTGNLSLANVKLGDSIATNGVCLTVIQLSSDGYWADVSRETLAFTTIGDLKIGARVNLEKALTPESHLGGHIVSGHVDGIGTVVSRHKDARSERFRLRAPDNLARYIAHKGSICVDGTSLTVNKVEGAEFELNIVPHTLEMTIFRDYSPGTRVNLEVDVIARYLERLILGNDASNPNYLGKNSEISFNLLRENGFLKM